MPVGRPSAPAPFVRSMANLRRPDLRFRASGVLRTLGLKARIIRLSAS